MHLISCQSARPKYGICIKRLGLGSVESLSFSKSSSTFTTVVIINRTLSRHLATTESGALSLITPSLVHPQRRPETPRSPTRRLTESATATAYDHLNITCHGADCASWQPRDDRSQSTCSPAPQSHIHLSPEGPIQARRSRTKLPYRFGLLPT